MRGHLTIALLGLLLCTAVAGAETGRAGCENGRFRIDADFDGGDLDRCRIRGRNSAELTFLPEDDSVNGAFSWFAFRVTASERREIRLKLRFPENYARFWPKVSTDGETWAPVAAEDAHRSKDGQSMTLVVEADADGTWVAAQELLALDWYQDWLDELDAHGETQIRTVGESVQGRPIRLVSTADRTEAVLLLGRQHPVETPGALAMRDFVSVVLADTELARAFRDRFTVLVVPLMNPDGVAGGHSRHNAGGTDLNRDWGEFTQPETRSIDQVLDALERGDKRLRLMLDFHATRQTETMIFYTQMPEDNTVPALFATNWLARARQRIGDYEIVHGARPVSTQGNAKNYFFRRYGIPAITYELADEIDRGILRRYTPIFAEEMMRLMLESTPALPAQGTAQ